MFEDSLRTDRFRSALHKAMGWYGRVKQYDIQRVGSLTSQSESGDVCRCEVEIIAEYDSVKSKETIYFNVRDSTTRIEYFDSKVIDGI
jgi:hypothetical protein